MSSQLRTSYHNGASPSALSPRQPALSIVKLLFILIAQLPFLRAAPVNRNGGYSIFDDDDLPKDPKDPGLYAYLGTAVALVLLGGAFAGLTIALMGQDEIYLQVIATSGEGSERKNAANVLRLLKKGKHWVLVTLLLSNVITNETLPIVLDRSLGGGWPAVLSSTVLIVIFGEIVPQSICVRYGLPIGAWMSPFVLALMWIMAPVAWPTAKLLDRLLGEDHGTTYKKAGLKTLVTLHKTLGSAPDERLNQDEVTIISAVLDLKDKPVGSIMTPMNDVFTMSADTVLDEKMMDNILSAGYSRIPIYAPDNPRDFVGMLLVKMLITYDPEDGKKVREFALATLPETRPETSCLDIVNFFQEGKSHMVLVSDFPGEPYGALGVVTLEDVIEELIGEEIIDESDVFVDVHKAIRRMAPAPRTRVPKGEIVTDQEGTRGQETDMENSFHQDQEAGDTSRKPSLSELARSPKATTFLMRRRSSNSNVPDNVQPVSSRDPDLKRHLSHLGPSNLATRPKTTKYSNVKIKPGVGTIPESGGKPHPDPDTPATGRSQSVTETSVPATHGGFGQGLLNSAGKDAKDGVQALQQGYGTMAASKARSENGGATGDMDGQNDRSSPTPTPSRTRSEPQEVQPDKIIIDANTIQRFQSNGSGTQTPTPGEADDKVGDMQHVSRSPSLRRNVRSGSITEQFVDYNGVKKMVLETTSSSDDDHDQAKANGNGEGSKQDESKDGQKAGDGAKKKRKKKRAGKNKKKGGEGESAPLLGGGKDDDD